MHLLPVKSQKYCWKQWICNHIFHNEESVLLYALLREYWEFRNMPSSCKAVLLLCEKMYEATRMTVPLVLLIYFNFLINLTYTFKGKLVPILVNCGCLLLSLHKDFNQGCLLFMAIKIYWQEFKNPEEYLLFSKSSNGIIFIHFHPISSRL